VEDKKKTGKGHKGDHHLLQGVGGVDRGKRSEKRNVKKDTKPRRSVGGESKKIKVDIEYK